MSTEIAQTGTTDLTITGDQGFWTDKQIAALRQLGVANAQNGDLAVFFHQCSRTGLDPFAKQIYMIERQGKQTIQTGIDGFRLVARRSTDRSRGTFGYEDTLWCGDNGRWVDVWLSTDAPAAAKVVVIRDGNRYPAVATYGEYVGLKRDGKPNQMWATKPALMLAKCAEALALRKAFPQDLSGLYTSDELTQDEQPQPARQPAPEPAPSSLAERLEPEPAQTVEEPDYDAIERHVADTTDLDKLRRVWKEMAGIDTDRARGVQDIVMARKKALETPEPADEPTPDEATQTLQDVMDAEVVDA